MEYGNRKSDTAVSIIFTGSFKCSRSTNTKSNDDKRMKSKSSFRLVSVKTAVMVLVLVEGGGVVYVDRDDNGKGLFFTLSQIHHQLGACQPVTMRKLQHREVIICRI